MATGTLGTNATTSLTSLKFLPGYASGTAAADMATINNGILSQLTNTNPKAGGAYFTNEGVLYFPDQMGMIKINPGDYIALDTASGWPIVVSAHAIATGPWTHT